MDTDNFIVIALLGVCIVGFALAGVVLLPVILFFVSCVNALG